MQIIYHRVNKSIQLADIDIKYGVEIDLRSNNGKIILEHDPFSEGEIFENWLQCFHHGTIILNIKEEGLEDMTVDILKRRNVHDYFFLDQSFPFLVNKNKTINKKTAVRYSEFEDIETVKKVRNLISWIWIDCFTKYPSSDLEILKYFQKEGIRLCLVSPELQGHNHINFVKQYKTLIKSYNLDAVCTKYPEFWEDF